MADDPCLTNDVICSVIGGKKCLYVLYIDSSFGAKWRRLAPYSITRGTANRRLDKAGN